MGGNFAGSTVYSGQVRRYVDSCSEDKKDHSANVNTNPYMLIDIDLNLYGCSGRAL